MKPLFRNIFFFFGLAAIIIMLLIFPMDYMEVWENIQKAGLWFFAVLGVWVVIYLFNTLSWNEILKRGEKHSPVPFWHLFKVSISGFALNYATPFGLMGGEPYRIMELAPYTGTTRATSSVILYVMMHIFSHICFWIFSIFLFVIFYTPSFAQYILLAITLGILLLLIYFFMLGYKHGMAQKSLKLLRCIPFIKKWASKIEQKHSATLEKIDKQIASLHGQNRSTFYKSFLFEFTARVLTSAEIYFILKILTPEVNFLDCIMIMAFTSLFANIFFFSPMQLGAREGGFAIAVGNLCMSGAFGVYTSLISRLREIIWIAIGLLLMRINPPKTSQKKSPRVLLIDYGGTLDTEGRHWANILWEAYQQAQVPTNKENFRKAYVYAERQLATQPLIQPNTTFHEVLEKKVEIELLHLNINPAKYIEQIVNYCYTYAQQQTSISTQVLESLHSNGIHMVVVSNFYGNLKTVLQEFNMLHLFDEVIESAVVGIRKPSPLIWQKGLEAATSHCTSLQRSEVIVVGDSFDKDILPAHELSLSTIWLKGEEWEDKPHDETIPSSIISSIEEIVLLIK